MNEEDVGKYFKDEDGSVWLLESYCASPTATLKRVGSNSKVGGAVGSLILSGFKKIEDNVQDAIKTIDRQYGAELDYESETRKLEVKTCVDCDCGKAKC